jgi:diketogulonate reductase-like aldo/keto reductase
MKMKLPFNMIYGTAWKKEKTTDLVYKAIKKGFRAIDTACQKKHYNEIGVGEALQKLYTKEGIKREDLFLQTKFTQIEGHNRKELPYNIDDTLENQILQSFNTSLKNLNTNYIDSYLLHSPFSNIESNLIAWKVLENLVNKGLIKYIGNYNIFFNNNIKYKK